MRAPGAQGQHALERHEKSTQLLRLEDDTDVQVTGKPLLLEQVRGDRKRKRPS